MKLFSPQTYINRRSELIVNSDNGILLFMGNNEAPMNYTDNAYRFRQDSNFLYYFGLNMAGLAAVVDVESNQTIVFGDEWTMDDIIWIGPHPSLKSLCVDVGIHELRPKSELIDYIQKARAASKNIHYLPPYRHDNVLKISSLLAMHPAEVKDSFSVDFVKNVVQQRGGKSEEEIKEMTYSVNVSRDMHMAAMQYTKAGMGENEVVGQILNIAKRHHCHLSYQPIFSINGQTLHNHYHNNIMKSGQLVLNDSGAENVMGYAGDITRTFPVSGKFSSKQKDIYTIVLEMEETSISMMKPGVLYRDIHIHSNRILLDGLKNLGLVSGDVEEMLQLGIGGLFMPHGLGHMIGLDVHDMEDLGEQFVGYRPGLERSKMLGLKSLRYAKELEVDNVLTVEPGLYFIPELIAKWKEEAMFTDMILYDKLEDYLDFGGVRIEDNVRVTEDGFEVLGKHIPKTVEEIESLMA